ATPALPAAGRYHLLDEIAHGGMGVIYRATDTVLDREVAVKVLQEQFALNSPVARRFLEEARITGQLQYPGVTAVYELGFGSWAQRKDGGANRATTVTSRDRRIGNIRWTS